MVEKEVLVRYEFKRKLEELRSLSGRATELISLYVPPTRQIHEVVSYLRNEFSQSSNIKSKSTRKNVMAAIESIMNRLKAFKRPPEHGMVFFVGHTAITGDQTDMVTYIIEPPEKITTFLYRCDSQFFLKPLEEMLTEKDVFGLLVIDRSEATIGFLRGKRISPVKNIQSLVPSKHGRGGQSQRRFERLIEIAAHEFFKKVGDLANETFLQEDELKGVLIGGPGSTKVFFMEREYLHHELKKKIIDTFDTGYTDEYGLKELMEKARERLSGIELMKEKKLLQRFLDEIRKPDGGLAVYGEDEVLRTLKIGAIDTLLISEAMRKRRIKISCQRCDFSQEKTIYEDNVSLGECPDCQSPLFIKENTDIIEGLVKTAESYGTTVELISSDSEEGEMFLRAFKGLGGVTRYKVGTT
ncbi:MAG: peptide chain release factor 1 [Methanomassiliicoccales archaeon]|nr:MAG: peptide chain release factor 1 [Methanomassiliicoccales archaeon]